MRNLAIVCLLLLAAPCARAAIVLVDVGGTQLVFTPQTVTINKGDTVTFVNKGGDHNVAADDGSFRCARGCDGMGGNGNASNANWTASVTFDKPGTVGYFCEIHGAPNQGMFGTVIVQGAAQEESKLAVPSGGIALYVLLACAVILVALRRQRRSPR